MTPEQLRMIQLVYGMSGGAQQMGQPQDPNVGNSSNPQQGAQGPRSDTQQSLLAALQGVDGMLTQRQQQENALPQNAPVQQANTNINQNAAQFISQLLAQPAPFTANDHLYNENIARQLGQAQVDAEVAKARMAKSGGANWQDTQKYSNAMGSVGELQAMQGHAPGQLQQKQNMDAMQPLVQSLGLAGALPKEQINDPSLLAALSKNVSDVSAADTTAQGHILANQMNSSGLVKAAEIKAGSDVTAAGIKAQADAATAAAKNSKEVGNNNALTKSALGKTQSAIQDHTNVLTSVGNLGKTFDPSYFTSGNNLKNSVLSTAERVGLPVGKVQEEFLGKRSAFMGGLEDVFNQYRKAITGAAASNQELEILKKSIVNSQNSPSQAKALMLDLMTKMETETVLAKQLLQHGIDNGIPIEPGNKKFADTIGEVLAGPEGLKLREQVKSEILKTHPQLGYGNTSDAASNAMPTSPSQETPEEATQKLMSLGYVRDPQTGQLRKQ